MDEFKREYSNKDTLKEALPYFWKNFEKDNYSIWYCNYKYNSELKKIFMTCNLIFNTAINHIPALLTHCSQLYNTQLIAQNKT
jgi:hypothetical protein